MTSSTKCKVALACNIIIVGIEIAALVYGFIHRGTSMFWYYTQDSNLFAGLVSLLFVADALRRRSWQPGARPQARAVRLLRYFATCCLCITFCVVVFVLAPNPLSGGYVKMLFTGTNVVVHTISPILCIVSFILFEGADCGGSEANPAGLPRRAALLSLIPSCVYAAFLYPANAMGVLRGPYPFFLVLEMPLWQSIAWFFGLMVGFFIIGALIRKAAAGAAARAARA